MRGKDTDRQWELFGKTLPYYGVLTSNEFKAPDAEAHQQFFRTGEAHLDETIKTIRNQLDGSFSPRRCLDFGCGVGRVLIPMAKEYPEVVGLDVSQSMLDEAGRNCLRYQVDNVHLYLSDDELSPVQGKFDFIHSYIVFQHIPPRRGKRLLKKLIDKLEIDGVAVLHVTYSTDNTITPVGRLKLWVEEHIPLAHNLVNVLKGRDFRYPYMMMHAYNLNGVFRILQEADCGPSYVRFTEHNNNLGLVIYCQKK